jgi:hypothetical protein
MSISQNFPSTRPSLNLNFARSKTLDPRITFTRTSSATYIDENGLIKIAPANSPRFDHDPVTGECLGLLVEEQRQNLLLRSEEFNNTSWVKSAVGIATNTTATTAPDGSNNAEKIVEDTTNSQHAVYQSRTGSNETVTFSVFCKSAGRDKILLQLSNFFTTSANATFNLSTGVIIAISSDNTDYTNTAATITQYPNGWYRCSITTTKGSVNTTNIPTISPLDSSGNVIYTGDGTSGIYIWGAQLEQGSFPTSYIPTSGSTATRTPDNASITGSNFSSWYNPTEWTLMIAARRNYSGNFLAFPNLARIWDGTINNNIAFYGAKDSPQLTNFSIGSGGVNQTPYVAINVPTTSQFKMIQALKKNDSTFGGNGTLTTTDTSVEMPVGVNQLLIGMGIGNYWGGTISQLTYYPSRLPDNQLINLTK